MRDDIDAVGGFFEDLPVLAFVLAGVISVAGTASWASGIMSEADSDEVLERSASFLACSVVLEFQDAGDLPTAEAVMRANLSGAVDSLPDKLGCLVSVWCVHPEDGLLLTVSRGAGEPGLACSATMLMNAICGGGLIGILEVRVLVWYA